MERILARIFLVLCLIFLTFVFYLYVNNIGILYSYHNRPDEFVCFYFTGISTQSFVYHKSVVQCPVWHDIY